MFEGTVRVHFHLLDVCGEIQYGSKKKWKDRKHANTSMCVLVCLHTLWVIHSLWLRWEWGVSSRLWVRERVCVFKKAGQGTAEFYFSENQQRQDCWTCICTGGGTDRFCWRHWFVGPWLDLALPVIGHMRDGSDLVTPDTMTDGPSG